MKSSSIVAIVIGVDLLINVSGLLFVDRLRHATIVEAQRENAVLTKRLDDAWSQRITLSASVEKACRR